MCVVIVFVGENRDFSSDSPDKLGPLFSSPPPSPAARTRSQEEEGTEYLQFSSPLTEIYSEIFLIPSSLLFWRVPLRKAEDGAIVLQGGQIISERKEL